MLQLPVLFVPEEVRVVGHVDHVFVTVGEFIELLLRFRFALVFVDEVVRKIGFADLEGGIVADGGVVHEHVGNDALGLNRAARGRVVAGRRELHADRLVAEGHRQDGLHGALPKGAVTHDDGALVVLQGARHDFGSGGRGGVDEHDDRYGFRERREIGERAHGVAAAVVGFDRLEDIVGLRRAALRRHHVGVGGQEGGGHADGRLQKAARVVSEVKNETL